ncbi:MAG TPA: hypothetical protein VGM06_23705 [Polyangiaceae bacterium]
MTEEKLGPGDAWGALEEMVTADEAVRVAALTDAQLDAELAKRGIDPARLHAAGEALAEELSSRSKLRAFEDTGHDGEDPAGDARADAEAEEASDEDEEVEELPPKARPVTRPRWVRWAVAAGVAAAVAVPLVGIPMVRRAVFSEPLGSGLPPDDSSVIRTQALHDCDEKLWLECWQKLDEAKAIDPSGEDTAAVRGARAAIRKALEPREP